MNTLGHKLRVTVFGQSHAPAIGCVVEGLPAGFIPDMDRLAAFLARRAPGRTAWSTPRQESDAPEILSGLVEGRTCGAPVCAVIRNGDQRSRDYEGLRRTPRPSHADYTAWVKYGESYDIRGGGQFSGRLTAPLCFAGALALQVLEQRGITATVRRRLGSDMQDEMPDFAAVDRETLKALLARPFPVFREDAGVAMRQEIERARMDADSVGAWSGASPWASPPGWGSPCSRGWRTGWPEPSSASPPSGGCPLARASPPPACGAASTTTPLSPTGQPSPPGPTTPAACWGASPPGCPWW